MSGKQQKNPRASEPEGRGEPPASGYGGLNHRGEMSKARLGRNN
jgi:hypothetical protein